MPLPPDGQFTTGSGGVTETLIDGNAVQTIQYASEANGLFAVSSVSTSYVDAGSATTHLWVNPYDRAEFTISNGSVTAVEAVNQQGVATPITQNSHTTYTSLAPGYVEAVTTFGSHSDYEVFYSGQDSGGVYTEVAHGSGSSVDLAGLETQIGQLPQATEWLI